MAEDTEAPRQVRRLQAQLQRTEAERDDAYEAIRTAGVKARSLRNDVKVYRDQVERLSAALTEIVGATDDEQLVRIARTAQAEAIEMGTDDE